jgi:hypothetical protein
LLAQPVNITLYGPGLDCLVIDCEPCQHRNITVTATKYCDECEEKYCESCTLSHMVQKRTKTHKLVDITKEIINKKLCEPCDSKNKSINATYVCDDCDENLCNVIWTGSGLSRFRLGSGTVPALLF